jgi:hypothetical protein
MVIEEPIDLISDNGDFYRVPAGAESDGCSIPEALWSTGLSPFGDYWLGAVVHDAAYRNTLLKKSGADFIPAGLTKSECDMLFLDCMIALGVPLKTRTEIYQGVNLGGWKAFKEDRSTVN